MRIALLVLCVALSGCRTGPDGSTRDDATTLIRDEKVPGLRSLYPGKTPDGWLALGYGKPSPMYRLGRDGALTPIGTVDLGDPGGEIFSARSRDTDAIWFLTPDVTAAVRWQDGTGTRIELGAFAAQDCDGCIIERVGSRRIVPGPDGGAIVVRNFADRPRIHRYCEVTQLSPTGVRARDVFNGFGEPVRTFGPPAVMVSERDERPLLYTLGETGWSSRKVAAARGYENWVAADRALYQIDREALMRVYPSVANLGSTSPFPGLRPLAIAPARGGGLWAIIESESAGSGASKSARVLVRLVDNERLRTSPPLPASYACVPAAPEELADGRILVPCRMWDGRVNSVDVLVDGQWQKLRSASMEATRIDVERTEASRRTARSLAPWLNDTSPMVLVFVHFLFFVGLWLTRRGAPRMGGSLLLGVIAAIIGAAVGYQFGSFERLASGWWRNDSLFPSFSREEWGLASITAATAAAYLGVSLSRRGAWPRVWGFVAASAVVPVLSALSSVMDWQIFTGTGGALLIGVSAWCYGFLASRSASESVPRPRPSGPVSRPRPSGAVPRVQAPEVVPHAPDAEAVPRELAGEAALRELGVEAVPRTPAPEAVPRAPAPEAVPRTQTSETPSRARVSYAVRSAERRPGDLPSRRPLRKWALESRAVRIAGIAIVVAVVVTAVYMALTYDPRAFRSRVFLLSGRMPEGWSSFESPGSLGFSRVEVHEHGRGTESVAWVSFVNSDPDRLLESYRKEQSPAYQVSELTIDEQPALMVQARNGRHYYVKNRRGELLAISIVNNPPAEELDTFISSLHFLWAPSISPKARYALRGKVQMYTGNCMPMAECKPQKVQREVVIRGSKEGVLPGDVVARLVTDGDGDFKVSLPPGVYHLYAIENGKEWCTNTGPYGPCGVRIIDRDVEGSVTIDHASW